MAACPCAANVSGSGPCTGQCTDQMAKKDAHTGRYHCGGLLRLQFNNPIIAEQCDGAATVCEQVMSPETGLGRELLDSQGDQTFQTAFGILDKDFDGRLTVSEAYRLVAYYSVSVTTTFGTSLPCCSA